jgi:putative phage-type endonuclease
VTAVAVKQRTPEWHALRQVSIGSSDLPVLVGLSSWKSEYELALEKAGQAPPEERPTDGDDPREVGELIEPVLLELYRRRTGRRARRVHRVITDPVRPWAIASLDGETIGETPKRDVELKHSWAVRWQSKALPEDVEVQVMWQMGVAGFRSADVCALVYGQLRIIPVDFDQSYFDDLVAIASRFRERIERGELPKPDGSDSARRALQTRFPADDGVFLPTSLETDAIALELMAAKADLAAAKNRVATAENAVRAILGDSTGVGSLDADGYRLTWKRTVGRTDVAWKQVATAYRAELDAARLVLAGTGLQGPTDEELDAIRDLYTETKPGSRRLLATFRDAPTTGEDE